MTDIRTAADLDKLDFAKGRGTVTVVAQDADSGAVLMVAHADRAALARTVETGEMHYLSRTRGPWHKGATSGNTQAVVSLAADCDQDAVLARVKPAGPACHTGAVSCFGDTVSASRPRSARGGEALEDLDATIEARSSDSENAASYTRRLLSDRNLRLKKLGEEAAELAVACADEDRERAVNEAADLFYHALVALRALGAGLTDVASVLAQRAR